MGMLLIAFVVAFGTALLWARLFLRRDELQPEPRRVLVALFLAGCIVTIPSAYIELLIETNHLVGVVVVAPLVEESLKMAAIVLIVWWSRHFDQLVDGVIYGVSCGLGFAAVENLLFGLFGGFGLLSARALVGPITHPFFTGIAGLYLGRARFERRPWLLLQGIALGVLLHAGWNLGPGLISQTGHEAYALIFFVVLILYAVLLRRLLAHLQTPEIQRLRTTFALGASQRTSPDAPPR